MAQRIGIFIQARNNSTRLPNKINLPFGESTVLETIVKTCKSIDILPKAVQLITKVISSHDDPVTTANPDDEFVSKTPVNDLVSRYVDAMKHYDVDFVIRITADCPLIPQDIIKDAIVNLLKYDYTSNVNPRTFIDGYDCQGISKAGMEWIDKHTQEREHPFYNLDFDLKTIKEFEEQGFTINRTLNGEQVILNPYHPKNKLSVDTQEDLDRCIKAIRKKTT